MLMGLLAQACSYRFRVGYYDFLGIDSDLIPLTLYGSLPIAGLYALLFVGLYCLLRCVIPRSISHRGLAVKFLLTVALLGFLYFLTSILPIAVQLFLNPEFNTHPSPIHHSRKNIGFLSQFSPYAALAVASLVCGILLLRVDKFRVSKTAPTLAIIVLAWSALHLSYQAGWSNALNQKGWSIATFNGEEYAVLRPEADKLCLININLNTKHYRILSSKDINLLTIKKDKRLSLN